MGIDDFGIRKYNIFMLMLDNNDKDADLSASDAQADEIEFEETNEEGEVGTYRDKEKKLREKLRQCEKERQEYLEGWQRSKADFINARKRNEESQQILREMIKEDIFLQVLSVVDSFDLAFRDKDVWERVEKNWRDGVEHIYTQLIGILKSNNIKEINPEGNNFDPQKHESVGSAQTEKENEDGKVIEVMQKGYEMNGRVLRPARVKVGEFKNLKSLPAGRQAKS